MDHEKLLVKIAEIYDGISDRLLSSYAQATIKILEDADLLRLEGGVYRTPALETYLVFERIGQVVEKQPASSVISSIHYEKLRDTKVKVQATSFAQARKLVRMMRPELNNISDENLRVVLS